MRWRASSHVRALELGISKIREMQPLFLPRINCRALRHWQPKPRWEINWIGIDVCEFGAKNKAEASCQFSTKLDLHNIKAELEILQNYSLTTLYDIDYTLSDQSLSTLVDNLQLDQIKVNRLAKARYSPRQLFNPHLSAAKPLPNFRLRNGKCHEDIGTWNKN